MEILIDLLWLVAGLTALYFGAEWLVDGAAHIAVRFGISPLVVGLTVVAFGTSAPELFVSYQFNFAGLADMSVGNVVGSNICNIGLILGVSALFYGLGVKSELLKRDMPTLLISSAIFLAIVWDLRVERWEGAVLAAGVIGYTIYCIWMSKRVGDTSLIEEFEEEFGEEGPKKQPSLLILVGKIIVGLVALYFGAEWLKKGGVNIAEAIGVPGAVISLTLIAFATSVPELATSIVAARKRQGDIIIGNVVGSCIFNLLCVIGFTALAKPMAIAEIKPADLGVMLAFTIICYPMMWHRRSVNWMEGTVLLVGYAAYVAWLFFNRGPDALPV